MHARPHGFDDTRGFITDARRKHRLLHVVTVIKHGFRAVQTDGLQADFSFASAWLARRQFFEDEILRSSELVETDGFRHTPILSVSVLADVLEHLAAGDPR